MQRWVGWFGFNSGSYLNTHTHTHTHTHAKVGGVVWVQRGELPMRGLAGAYGNGGDADIDCYEHLDVDGDRVVH